MLTSVFLYGGWMHLTGNMWLLWIFGDNIEEVLGRLRFVLYPRARVDTLFFLPFFFVVRVVPLAA